MRASARRSLTAALFGAFALSAPSAARSDEGDEPLRPREETPEDAERLRARPRFRRPSELPGAGDAGQPPEPALDLAPAALGPPLPALADPSALRLSDYQPPSIRGRYVGPFVELGGEPFAVRPTYVRPLVAEPGLLPADPDGQLSVRGLYAYVSGEKRDWTGVELAGSVDVASGVTAGALFRHELRDEAANLAVASISAPLGAAHRLVGTLGMGFGGAFVPLVDLGVEWRGLVPGSRKVHFGLGGRAAFWGGGLRSFEGALAGIFWSVGGISGEQRLHVRVFDSDASSPRLLPGISTALLEGEPGDRQLEQRLSLSMLPRYAPGAELAGLSSEPTVDAWLGLREWLAPGYGFVAGLDFGAQRGSYVRVGADVAAFVTF